MSAELTWVLMVVWFVVTTSAIGELSCRWIVARVPPKRRALRASPLKRLRQYLLSEQAHSVIQWWIGADRAKERLGVAGRQTPEVRRRDPRAVPGGNLTDPIQSTTLVYG